VPRTTATLEERKRAQCAPPVWPILPVGEAVTRTAQVIACQACLEQLVWPSSGQKHCGTNHRDGARSFWRRSSHRMPARSPDFVIAERNAFSHGACLSAAHAEWCCLNNLTCKRSVLLLPYLQVSFSAMCWYGLLPEPTYADTPRPIRASWTAPHVTETLSLAQRVSPGLAGSGHRISHVCILKL